MEINLSPGAECRLTLLNTTYPSDAMPAHIEDVNGLQLHLSVASALAFAAPLKLESDDAVVLGDVTHCDPYGDGFLIGMTVRHTMDTLVSLASLNEALSEETAPVETPAATS